MASLTTLGVGGTASWHARVGSTEQFNQALAWAEEKNLQVLYMGEGSNIVCSDDGFPGLVLQSSLTGREQNGCEVVVGGADSLNETIEWLNARGLGGAERLYGIPGTVAGALVGNAGAYGQQVSDLVVSVEVWTPNGPKVLTPGDLEFGYRHSALKSHRQWFIAACRLCLTKDCERLQEISREILAKRLVKYPPGLRCPGSFFKNVPLEEISEEALSRLPSEFILFGKVPAGKLLEAVGANGVRRGDAQFASYHGNLIVNLGSATCRDILGLTEEYSRRVWERFAVRLEPEVLILNEAATGPAGGG